MEQRACLDRPAAGHVITTRTKMVATIGPASQSRDVLRQLMEAGVDVFRLNFSHGTHEQHSAALANIRSLSRDMGQHVAVLQDLCGPKIRLDLLADDIVECRLNEEFTLVPERTQADARELACSYRELPKDLKRGEVILFADGTVAMTVVDVAPGRARLKVTTPGRLRSRQGLNLPGTDLAIDSLTEKDLDDLDWTACHADDVDFVGLSFVRAPDDVERLRRELKSRHCSSHIVVKIEKPQAVDRLEEIVMAADAVMVARGDLGVELDAHRVPALQKRIIALCNQIQRPVITATQMLDSMERSSRPTRAEASDVFNAVLDGTDAVMLSGESAIGLFPVEAAKAMRSICAEAEAYLKSNRRGARAPSPAQPAAIDPITEASVHAASLMLQELDAALVIVAADSHRTVLSLSNCRPAATILALVRSDQAARGLCLCWGVTPVVLPDFTWAEGVLRYGIEWAKSHALVTAGQRAALLRGHVADRPDIAAVLAAVVG